MKTIQLPDYLADALIATGEELAVQDNLGTAWPIWYVSEIRKVERSAGSSDFKERIDSDFIDVNKLCEDCKKADLEDGELPESCDSWECSDSFWYYDRERQYTTYGSAFFLTQKACQEYIDDNAYHFDDPAPYCVSAHRNLELQTLIQALILIAGKTVPSNHYGVVHEDTSMDV